MNQTEEDYELEEFEPEGKTDDEKCQSCISKIIDLKSLADMYIFNEIVCDPDIYLTSFFMDVDFGTGGDKLLRFEAPWDFDSTMGNKRHCADGQGMFAGVTGYEVNYERTGTGNGKNRVEGTARSLQGTADHTAVHLAGYRRVFPVPGEKNEAKELKKWYD